MNRFFLLSSSIIFFFCLIFNDCRRCDAAPVGGAVVIQDNNRINNSSLIVAFDPQTRCFNMTSKPAGKRVVKNIVLGVDFVKVRKQNVIDATFGKGEALIASNADGASISLVLYASEPFVFIKQTVKNVGDSVIDIPRLKPVSFLVDLGKPFTALKTLGTGGLFDPDKNPGSYVFLTTVDPVSRNGVVAGWLTNEKGSGVLFSQVKNSLVEVRSQIDYGHFRLSAKGSENTETLVVGYFDDARLGEEQFAAAIAKKQNIKLKPRSAVYCTWYSEKNGGAGNESSMIELTHFIKDQLKPFGLNVLQIDDQWQAGDQYNGPHRRFNQVDPKGGYPNGFSATTKAIKDAGMTAGIWWMPFSRNHQDPVYLDHQDWFAHRTNGKPFETTWGGTSLDLTNPEVQKHIADYASTLHNWGFDYFKMDGLWTGMVTEQIYINDGYKNDSIGNSRPLFDPLKTQIEAYRDGLRIIRKAAGENVFLSGCCVSQNMRSFGASMGLVNSMRIGPDFNHDGQSIRTGAIRASRLYFLNGRVWWNDPDPSMLRESGESTADGASKGIGSLTRARLLPSFVTVSGQFFLSSDWLPNLPLDRIEIMKRCMASHTGIARPVDAFDKMLPSIWIATDKKSGTSRNILGLFNWETSAQKIGTTLTRAGLKYNKRYYAFDFWENKPLADIEGSFEWLLPSESCKVIAVREKSNHPVLVSTSQHITQGMIDVLKEEWKAGSLSGTSKIIAGDSYELRIAGMNDGGTWKLAAATVIGNPDGVTIKTLPKSEKGWLRVVITCNESRIIKWQLKFSK
jgi:hypothetical protein